MIKVAPHMTGQPANPPLERSGARVIYVIEAGGCRRPLNGRVVMRTLAGLRPKNERRKRS